MKLWSETLTASRLSDAAAEVRADFPGSQVYLSDELFLHEGPRSRRFDNVCLRTRTGIYGAPEPQDGSERSASFCEHGWWMARVFAKDPDARVIGGWMYERADYRGAAMFHDLTYGAFVIEANPREIQVHRALGEIHRSGALSH